MGATPPPVQTISHITVDIDGVAAAGDMDQLLFSACDPPSWTVEAPKHIFHGNDGTPQTIISAIQNPSYSPMTLTQGWDPNMVLAKWMADVQKPGEITDKKKKITVVFLDSNKQPLFQWYTESGILTEFKHSASDASSNSVLTVTARIDADTWELQDGSGSALA